MAYKVFISYRRKNASDLGQLLYERLCKDNFQPFFDVEEMESGGFNEQLYERIDECSAVIVLLSENALDERDPGADDWMRIELGYAFKQHKKVIPIFKEGFKFPDTLPDDIAPIKYCHGIPLHEGYFDAAYTKLRKMISDHSAQPAQHIKIPAVGVCAVTGAFAGAVLALIGRSISPDVSPFLSGLAAHTLLVMALFGAAAGMAIDMLIEMISTRANQAVIITLGILITVALTFLTGFIPATVLMILTSAGCAALMLKFLIK